MLCHPVIRVDQTGR